MFLYQDQICLQNIQSAVRDIFVKRRESYIRLSFPIHMFIYTLESLWKVDELLTFFYHLFSRFGEHDILVYLGVTDSAELGQFIITWWVLISYRTIWFWWENSEFPKYKHLLFLQRPSFNRNYTNERQGNEQICPQAYLSFNLFFYFCGLLWMVYLWNFEKKKLWIN